MRNLFTALLIIVSSSIFSQNNTEQLFKNLHNGAILVRLTSNSNTLKALKGKDDVLAAKIVKQRDEKNREIIDAFASQLTLCPVYYFYSDDTKAIVEKNFEGVLLDSDLNRVNEFPALNSNYLVASFSGTHENKEIEEYENVRYSDRNSEGKLYVDDVKVQQSTDMEGGVDALVLYSPEIVELQSPYPHYVRTFERLPFIKRSKEKTVERLQYKIEKYLKEL